MIVTIGGLSLSSDRSMSLSLKFISKDLWFAATSVNFGKFILIVFAAGPSPTIRSAKLPEANGIGVESISTQTENPSEEIDAATQTDLDDQRSEVSTQTENAKNYKSRFI